MRGRVQPPRAVCGDQHVRHDRAVSAVPSLDQHGAQPSRDQQARRRLCLCPASSKPARPPAPQPPARWASPAWPAGAAAAALRRRPPQRPAPRCRQHRVDDHRPAVACQPSTIAAAVAGPTAIPIFTAAGRNAAIAPRNASRTAAGSRGSTRCTASPCSVHAVPTACARAPRAAAAATSRSNPAPPEGSIPPTTTTKTGRPRCLRRFHRARII